MIGGLRASTHTHRQGLRFGTMMVRPSIPGSQTTTETMGPDHMQCRKTAGRDREINIGIIGI